MIEMLNPVSPRREGEIIAVPRLSSLDGKLIGLLHNGKHGGEEILLGIRDALRPLAKNATFDYRRKPHAAAPASFLSSAVGKWHAAVVAIGDCGSCSSWSVHDSIELEKSGIPVVLLVTNPFVAMNRVEAKRLLMPSLSMIVVQHPLAHLPTDELKAKGAAVVDQVVAMLTGSSAKESVTRLPSRIAVSA